MANSDQSMGDIFAQRRAAKTKGSNSTPNLAPSTTLTPSVEGRPPSFAEIQAEQKKDNDRMHANRGPSSDRRGGDRNGFQSSNRSDRKVDSFSARSSSFRNEDSRSSSFHNERDSSFRGNDRRDNRGRGRPDRSALPLERGCISSLKDSFGFIYCADREDELFFHYSEVSGILPTDLMTDDELEFRVGESKNSDKLAAFEVIVLERGTIVWEVEDEPGVRFQGIVEKPLRTDRGSINVNEGSIRMLLAANTAVDETGVLENAAKEAAAIASGPVVKYTASDYGPEKGSESERTFRRSDSTNSQSSRGPSNRLGTNDLVEFNVVTSSRNKAKYARDIKLLQSDHERQRLAMEKELIENASVEKGVVSSLKNDFGFLKSNRRREEIHFHYSQVELPDDGDEDDYELKEGQDMEFLVITEPGGKGGRDRTSARRVRFLPRGSVVFHKVIASGVTGTITRPPHASDTKYTSELVGRVQLSIPLRDTDDDGNESIITEISFHPSDSPGGTFSFREGNSVGLWVHEGDVLLFDVIKDLIEGECRVGPTKYVMPGSEEKKEHDTPCVKLISTSLAGRAEGVIQAVKDGFGFIHLAERSVDVYFRLFELMPDAMQSDIRKNMGVADTVNGAPLRFQVGTEVQFDLSLQGMGSRNRNRKGQRIQQEKENLKAQRMVLLPPGTICETKVIALGAKGVVTKEDPKQPYAGQIDLEKEWAPMTSEERHPLVSRLIKSFLASDETNGPKSIVFPDILAAKDDEVVANLVEFYGKGSLKITHIPVSGERDKAGRICIMKINDGMEIPAGYNEEESRVDCFKTDLEETEGKSEDGARVSPTKKKGKKLIEMERPIKVIRFDKHCLVEDLRRNTPPSIGDVVTCDIIQSRRTGAVYLANVNITERSKVQSGYVAPSDSAIGIVTEVVAARQFGFISVHDENSTKRELLFFHTKSVVTAPPRRLSAKGSSAARSNSPTCPPSIKKGDEVQFDITVGENGKKSAVNVRIVPKGSLMIPVKAAKNACFGIVLMEPSHTTHKNTPNRKGGKSPMRGAGSKSPMRGAGASRWENVDLEEKEVAGTDVKEEGFILLTKDPSNIFAVRSKSESMDLERRAASVLSVVPSSSGHLVDTADEAEKLTADNELVHLDATSALCSSLPYKTGAVAMHGNGAASGADGTGGPRRGDLVSFVKANSGKGVRDVRVVTKAAATMQRGRLEKIVISRAVDGLSVGTAKFIAATDREEEYVVDLKEVISCDPSLLKENESVEGIIHEGQIFGICRSCDLYLESKLGLSHKERPKLNLTVRKGLGGTIMAQSGMAKGPDGTYGFAKGWTARVSQYNGGLPMESEFTLATESAI